MSLYSDKCDFSDTVEIHGVDNILKSRVYVGDNIVPLKMELEKDLVPYYPYLISISASENGVGSFRLTTESFVDREERERLEWYQKEAIRYVNRCKRRKEEIGIEKYLVYVGRFYEDQQVQILQRVQNKDMSLDDIHLPMAEYYREQLYKEMLKVGWDERQARLWCYGWREDSNSNFVM